MKASVANFLMLICVFSSTADAIESALPQAAGLPEFSEESAEKLTFFKATNAATTFFDRLASDAFRDDRERRELTLRKLPEERSEALSALTRSLLSEGFEAFDLVSKRPTPRFERTLSRSVCVVLGAKTRTARAQKATLVTSDLADSRTSAAVLGLAKLMQAFRLEARPIWICTYTSDATLQSKSSALRELLSTGKDKPTFSTHIALAGNDANAYVNFLGHETTRFEFQERQRHWIRKDGDTALEAARFVRDELLRVADKHGAWANSKKSPWITTKIGPVRCESSLIASVRNVCRFDVVSASRSRVALSEKTLALVHTALTQTEHFNALLHATKQKPIVRLSLPKNTARVAVAGGVTGNEAVQAWRVSLGKNPPPELLLSSRFIDSEAAATSALAQIPTVVLSCCGKTEEQNRERLTRLAETLLLLCGMCDAPPPEGR